MELLQLHLAVVDNASRDIISSEADGLFAFYHWAMDLRSSTDWTVTV